MDFDTLVGHLDYPMVVVTVAADDGPTGCLVGFHTQVSIDPARYLVCLSKTNRTTRAAGDGAVLGVHFLAPDQLDLARWFGTTSADDVDKAAPVSWEEGSDGAPLLAEVEAKFVGRTLEVVDLGDHRGHVLEPVSASGPDTDVELLGFRAVRHLEPGHEA